MAMWSPTSNSKSHLLMIFSFIGKEDTQSKLFFIKRMLSLQNISKVRKLETWIGLRNWLGQYPAANNILNNWNEKCIRSNLVIGTERKKMAVHQEG